MNYSDPRIISKYVDGIISAVKRTFCDNDIINEIDNISNSLSDCIHKIDSAISWKMNYFILIGADISNFLQTDNVFASRLITLLIRNKHIPMLSSIITAMNRKKLAIQGIKKCIIYSNTQLPKDQLKSIISYLEKADFLKNFKLETINEIDTSLSSGIVIVIDSMVLNLTEEYLLYKLKNYIMNTIVSRYDA